MDRLTVEQETKFWDLLTIWLNSELDSDYDILLNHLKKAQSENPKSFIYYRYEGLDLEKFREVRTILNYIPKDVFILLFKEHYSENPKRFLNYSIPQKAIIKKRSWWEETFKPIDYSKLNPYAPENKDFFTFEPYDGKKVYEALNFFSQVYDRKMAQTNYEKSELKGNEKNEIFSKERGVYVGGGYHFNGDGHLLTVGGSGAGKGVNFIIPALLSPALVVSGSSIVMLDPKGENLAICGEHLKKNGYNVLVINPFNISEISGFGKTGFNPFSLTSKNDIEAPKFCDLIAECLIPDAGANSAHWTDSARQYISLYLLYMVATDQANFQNLFEAIRLGGSKRLDYLYKMSQCKAFGGIIAATAGGIYDQLERSDDNKEIESIFSTVRRGTDIFKDLQLRQHLSKSDFDLTKLAHEKTALFVCVNPAELQLFSGWLRVFFGCVFRNLQKNYNPNKRVLMILDEFPQIGRLREFEMAVAYMRGYNVTIWAIIQDLSQLKKLYWDSWESFVGSAAVKMWLPLGADNFTIDYLYNRLPVTDKKRIKDGKIEQYKETYKNKFELITSDKAILEVRGLGEFPELDKIPYWSLAWGKNASPNPFRK